MKIKLIMFLFFGLALIGSVLGATGDYISNFSVSTLTAPYGIATNNGTYLWVLDYGDDEVYKYYANGTYTGSHFDTSQASYSYEITTNGSYFWIVSYNDQKVYKYEADGTYVTSYDTSSQGTDNYGITNDGTNIWILDKNDAEVYKYYMNMTYTGSSFDTSSQGSYNIGITTDGTNIWVLELTDSKVYKYDMDGNYANFYFDTSDHGSVNEGITTDKDDSIWVVDSVTKEVYKYDLDLRIIKIELIFPADNEVLSATGTNFTANYSSTNYNFTNTTYYIWNSTGIFNNSVIVNITGTENSTTEFIEGFVLGNYEWNVFACWENATFSNCSFATANYSLSIGASINDVNYTEYVYETSSQTFVANISLLSGSELSIAQFVYNGTSYDISNISINGDHILLTRTIDIPANPNPFKNATNAFWFSFTYTDVTSTNQNTTSLNQNVSFINLQLCNSTYNVLSINFSIKDEITKSLINSSANNTNNQAFFNYWLGSGTEVKNYSFERLSSTTNNTYEICIFPNKTFGVDMDMVYSAQAHDEKTYILRNASITNVSSAIDLFLLFENLATKFTIEVRQGVSILTEAVVTVARFFVGEGAYRTTSIRETDEAGEFVEYLDLDNDYRYSIVKDGVLLGVIDKKATCTEAPCEFTLQIPESIGDIFEGYEDNYARNIYSNISFDLDTKIVSYEFIDITGLAQYFRLKVTQGFYNGTGVEICNQQVFSSSGSMTCNVTGYEGNFVAVGTVSRSPELIDQILEFVSGSLKDTLGLMAIFISFAIILTITIAGAVLSGGNPSMVLGGFGLGILATKLMTLLPFSWGLVALIELFILIIMGWLKT